MRVRLFFTILLLALTSCTTTNDYWKDVLILFGTGNLAGQIKKVTGYIGSSKIFTFTPGK